MSCSYHSYAIVGVPFDSLYTERKEKGSKTQYDQDTGKPYQKETIVTRFFWCDKEVEEYDDQESFVEEMCGLEVHDAGYGNGGAVVGVLLAQADPGEVISVSGPDVSKAFAEAKEKLQKSGYNGNNIQLHIISYVSC